MYPAGRELRWQDGERLIRVGRAALADAPALLSETGFDGYTLVTTSRAARDVPALTAAAEVIVDVPGGGVPDAAQAVRGEAGGRPLVAVGGGRVIDVAKAIASAEGLPVAAVPTTLAGAEMNGHHRPIPGFESAPRRRPVLVIFDPALLESMDEAGRAATAMNALAHAVEALYTPAANPLTEAAGLEAARQIRAGLEGSDTAPLALGGVLAGYAIGVAGFAVHHVLCQTLVRLEGTPHAETNAVVLPAVVDLMAERAPREMALLADAVGSPDDAAAGVRALAGRTGARTLRDLGVHGSLDGVIDAALARDELSRTPGGAAREDLRRILDRVR